MMKCVDNIVVLAGQARGILINIFWAQILVKRITKPEVQRNFLTYFIIVADVDGAFQSVLFRKEIFCDEGFRSLWFKMPWCQLIPDTAQPRVDGMLGVWEIAHIRFGVPLP